MGALQVLGTALANERRRPKAPKRNADELAFLPAALELVETPPSPVGRATTWTIMAFFAIALAWSCIGEIDMHATATGRIIPNGHVKVIQPLEPGTVRAIHVDNGSVVKAGDVLVELDPTESNADRERLATDLITAVTEAARLQAQIAAVTDDTPLEALTFPAPKAAPDAMVQRQRNLLHALVAAQRAQIAVLDSQAAQQRAERVRLQASLAERDKLIGVLTERANMLQGLAAKRIGTRSSYLQVAQDLHAEGATRASERGRLGEIDAALIELDRRKQEADAEFLSKASDDLTETEKKIAGLKQEVIKAIKRDERNRLRAPVSGVVQEVSVHTKGAVVKTGDQLMIVVPAKGGIEVEAMVENRDRGFVEAGQPAEIKVETFPYTKYGTIPGKVVQVSTDSIERKDGGLVFPARVTLSRDFIHADGEDVPLSPGMAVTAEVKTGHRKVIEYLLTPLLRYRDEAMRER